MARLALKYISASRGRVEAHLASCAGCRRKHRLIAATRDAFRNLSAGPAPAGFERRLHHRLAQKRLPPEHRGARRWLPAIALAAAVAVASLALNFLSPDERPDRPATPESSWQTDRALLEAGSRWQTAVSACGMAESADYQPILPCSTADACGPPIDAVGRALMSM